MCRRALVSSARSVKALSRCCDCQCVLPSYRDRRSQVNYGTALLTAVESSFPFGRWYSRSDLIQSLWRPHLIDQCLDQLSAFHLLRFFKFIVGLKRQIVL